MSSYHYTPHKRQWAFHHAVESHKVTLFNAGRGTGKTVAGVMQSLIMAYRRKTSGLIVAPTYDMLQDIIIPMFYDIIPTEMDRGYKKQSKKLTLSNGSMITFRSGDNPSRLRGANRDWVWLDEARNYDDDEVYRVTLATLRGNQVDKMWITTTPAGLYHWLYTKLVAPRDKNIAFVSARTLDNPHLPADFYQFLRTQYTGVYADQELEGKFVSFEGLVYDTFDLIGNVSDVRYDPALPTYWAVDDGYAHGDGEGSPSYHPRVILIMQQTNTGGFNVVYEYRATLELPEISIANVLSQFPRLPDGAYVDSSAQELKRRLADVGILSANATHKISDGIKVVRRFIQDGNGVRQLQIHPSCKGLIRELQTYRWSDSMDGLEPRPYKRDDHACDALRYGLYPFR